MDVRLDPTQLTRLRMVLGRLGRLLRQQSVDGLTYPQISLLFSIERAQPVSAGELATREAVTPAAVTRSLNELERLGLVRRVTHDVDRRVSMVAMTEAGRGECVRLRSVRELWLAEHLDRLTAAEVGVLLSALPVLERLCEPGLPETSR
jgi:DNA-binding MarR family transcriptional regulator